MNLSELRAQALERDGGCVWPGCGVRNPDWLQLAHLIHRGMGSLKSVNTLENTVMLCAGPDTLDHHGILDGRTVAGRRLEVCGLLAAYLRRERCGGSSS